MNGPPRKPRFNDVRKEVAVDHIIRSTLTLVLGDGTSFEEEITKCADGKAFLRRAREKIMGVPAVWLDVQTEYVPAGHTIRAAVFNDGSVILDEFGTEYRTVAHSMKLSGRRHPFLTRLLREACRREDDDMRISLCGLRGMIQGSIDLVLFAGKKYFNCAENCHAAFLFSDHGNHTNCAQKA